MIKLSSIGGFFEEHVEKIILVIVGLVCVWLLITRVIFSPNTVTYNKAKWSPSAIDAEILKEAKDLEQTLRKPPEKAEPYKSRAEEFLAKLDSSISDVDIESRVLAPREAVAASAVGVYDLPRIGEVTGVAVEHIRAVAYVPIDEVTEQNTYDKSGNEPNDLDLITVEAKVDMAGLYDRFKERWADPCLAKPLFAAVQLQRQERNGDGTWSQWEDVPRAKVDPYKKLFGIVDNVNDLPAGGLKVRMLQYDYQPVQISLLQPEPYQFATADEEWLPPELHKKYKQIKAKEALEEKREAMEEAREERQKERDGGTGIGTGPGAIGGAAGGRRPRGAARSRSNRGVGGDTVGNPDYGMGNSRSSRGGRSRTSRGRTTTGQVDSRGRSTARGSRGRSSDTLGDMLYGPETGPGAGGRNPRYSPINEVYDKYDEMMLTRLTDFKKLEELTFWAHDDTVEPRKAYRYRIRLGVFNPIAGTDKVSAKNLAQKDEVILWSGYSDVTEPIEIMGRLYFFANNVREADKAVTVQVSRLALGRWHSHDFQVRDGEVIGEPLEPEPETDDRSNRQRRLSGVSDTMGRFSPLARTEQSNVPEIVDYRTGAVMVDAVVVNDWSGKMPLHSRKYYDMLYSFDGVTIEHMPVGATYRPTALALVHSHITRMQRETQEPFKGFGTTDRRQRRGGDFGEMDGVYDDYYMEDMYMMEQMGGGGRRR
jgi:hypothetical protein